MNREDAKNLLPIITAFADGKEVEMLDKRDGKWIPAPNPGFAYTPDRYRIKPEPKEIWVNEFPDGYCAGYSNEAVARRSGGDCTTRIAVRYREVLED